MTALASANAIVVLYSGSNKALQEQVLAGASRAKDEGIYVRGMVIATSTPEILDGKDYVQIYVDGMPVTNPGDVQDWDKEFSKFTNPDVSISNLIYKNIIRANEEDLQPALQRRQTKDSISAPKQ
jgi:hypothetical protein